MRHSRHYAASRTMPRGIEPDPRTYVIMDALCSWGHSLRGIVRRHCQDCPSLRKKRVAPHVLRHSAAMELLQGGVDRAVIALWLGHESVETTQIYLDADLALKEKALAKTTPMAKGKASGRYRPHDKLLAFLKSL